MFNARVQPRAEDYRGFTVPELVFVLSFIALALGVFLFASSFLRMNGRYDRRYATILNIALLEDATDMYIVGVGSCPTTKQGLEALLVPPADLPDPTKWTGPYLEKVDLPVDSWSHPFHYQALGPKTYRIWSSGPNGKNEQGRGDDVANAT